MEIILPPTLARDLILSVMHYIPPYSGVDRIRISEDRVILEGNDPTNGLAEALRTIADNVKKNRFSIPLSGNDRGIVRKLFKCYGINENDTSDRQILTFANSLLNVCREEHLPSLLKPELYEYNRTPGYSGKRKMEITYPSMSIMLGLIGYLGSKVGVKIERRTRQSVLFVPQEVWIIDPRELYFSLSLKRFLDYMGNRLFPNIYPETALILWLALHIDLSNFKLLIISDPAGQNPATLNSQLAIDLSRVKEALKKYEILRDSDVYKRLDHILLDALSNEPEPATIRFSTLLYEMLLEIKPWDETLFFGLRDYMSNLLIGEKRKPILEDIGIVCKVIFKKISSKE
ncbi:MAG: hypothetical protein ACP5GU_08125 [Thermoprotei archaeon]|jgi:hypothetical protein